MVTSGLMITAMRTFEVCARDAMRTGQGSRVRQPCMPLVTQGYVCRPLGLHSQLFIAERNIDGWGCLPPPGVPARQGLTSPGLYAFPVQSAPSVRITLRNVVTESDRCTELLGSC